MPFITSGQVLRGPEPMPSLGGTLIPWAHHRQHRDARKTRVHLILGESAMPGHGLVALGTVAVGIAGSKHGNFCLNRLRQNVAPPG